MLAGTVVRCPSPVRHINSVRFDHPKCYYAAIARPRAPNARPGHTASESESFPAALPELRDAEEELVEEADSVATKASAVLVGDESLPEATITLVTVDCCAVSPVGAAAGTVVRNVEVASLTVLTVLDPDVALRVAVVERAVPLTVVEVGAMRTVIEEVLAFASAPELTQVMEPTCTSLVLRYAPWLLVNELPAWPVPLG